MLQVLNRFDLEDEGRLVIAALILEIITAVADFLFLFPIAKARQKNDNTPLPLPVLGVVCLFLILVNAFFADDTITDTVVVANETAKQVLLILRRKAIRIPLQS